MLFLLTALAFFSVLGAAGYRAVKQPVFDPAVIHVVPTGLGCLLAGCGALVLGLWADPIGQALGQYLLCFGMWAVAGSIIYCLPDIASQPTLTALQQARQDLARVRREREDLRRQLIRARFAQCADILSSASADELQQ